MYDGHPHPCFGPMTRFQFTGPRSAVGNVSGYRCVSDCRSRGCEFDPGPVPYFRPGRVAQSVTCLATDASLIADPGVASSIPARSHTFVEIDHEMISTRTPRSFSSLPLNHSRRIVVSYMPKYVHEVLVNCLFKLAQEKVWLGELTVPQ